MSVFAKLFGGGKSKNENPQEAVQKLRDLEEVHQKKADYLEKKIADEIKTAKENATKNKRVALTALRRKKRYEEQLQTVQGTLMNLEMQRETIVNAKANAEVMRAMQAGGSALKNAQKEFKDVDKVHEVMDDFAEQQDISKEISEAISQPTGPIMDDDELERELQDLEQEQLDEELLNVGPLPTVPSASPATAAASSSPAGKTSTKAMTDEEKELEELAQWAS